MLDLQIKKMNKIFLLISFALIFLVNFNDILVLKKWLINYLFLVFFFMHSRSDIFTITRANITHVC